MPGEKVNFFNRRYLDARQFPFNQCIRLGAENSEFALSALR